ncbi:hypothetical protein BT63DRAFT_479694 [Microthyrium microscopicum]|uniref:Uncharacterized protein n=1 Tax=Microthyrium microscopicum TaxID=703497 RepID=A0A6A6U7Z2_9PEZI|nr:hypothetical protein BT63DRAFT_479694 [Microthyrium microscopicum]
MSISMVSLSPIGYIPIPIPYEIEVLSPAQRGARYNSAKIDVFVDIIGSNRRQKILADYPLRLLQTILPKFCGRFNINRPGQPVVLPAHISDANLFVTYCQWGSELVTHHDTLSSRGSLQIPVDRQDIKDIMSKYQMLRFMELYSYKIAELEALHYFKDRTPTVGEMDLLFVTLDGRETTDIILRRYVETAHLGLGMAIAEDELTAHMERRHSQSAQFMVWIRSTRDPEYHNFLERKRSLARDYVKTHCGNGLSDEEAAVRTMEYLNDHNVALEPKNDRMLRPMEASNLQLKLTSHKLILDYSILAKRHEDAIAEQIEKGLI